MTVKALVLSRDADLRRRLVDRMRAVGDGAVGFGEGRSAFLWACGVGRLRQLEALILDESIDSSEANALRRRLTLLHPDLRTILLRTERSAPALLAAAGSAAAPSRSGNLDSNVMRFVRACREQPRPALREPTVREDRLAADEGGYATG